MSNAWFATPQTTPRFTEPETIFVRFVARNYYPAEFRSDIKFLELGSGSGGDLKYLQRQGFCAIGIDSNPLAYANYHEDIADVLPDYNEYFDCVYDLNVLCTIKDPPYREIAAALKPGGKFFAIMPALGTEADYSHLEYVKISRPEEIRAALAGLFSKVELRPYNYWHHQLHSNWVVEASK